MENETFYFVIYRGSNAVTVIDLAYCVDYERDEFPCINQEDFTTPEDAIAHAKAIAEKYGLEYVPFESRYNSELNERCNLTLD